MSTAADALLKISNKKATPWGGFFLSKMFYLASTYFLRGLP
ncbi:MAG: hypothetical protein RLZZ346_497, partial [Cyanobacteriota bacterium]